MAFKFRRVKNPVVVRLPSQPSIAQDPPENLMGQVQGKQASAPEERMANALVKNNKQFLFRYTFGAPKGMPGWKEVDFLIVSGGLIYAAEVDTAFTHRNKEQKDKLHDSLILADKELQTLGTLYPKVFHADGDMELSDEKQADQYVRMTFGR